jgi:hypothetical protein
MRALEVDITGQTTEKEVGKKDLTMRFAMHSRDLRPILSLRQMPTLSRRGNAIVLNFRSVKILVGENSALVFNLESDKITNKFIPELVERLKIREKVRFEHAVLEGALLYILAKTRVKYERLLRAAEFMLESLRVSLKDEKFEKLLVIKKQISKLGKNARELTEILDEIVDDDEEMLELYFGKTPADPDEIESILEDAVEQIEDVSNRIEELERKHRRHTGNHDVETLEPPKRDHSGRIAPHGRDRDFFVSRGGRRNFWDEHPQHHRTKPSSVRRGGGTAGRVCSVERHPARSLDATEEDFVNFKKHEIPCKHTLAFPFFGVCVCFFFFLVRQFPDYNCCWISTWIWTR